MNADVAVIGIGSMGSMALWQLAKMGVNVIGIEQFTPGHDKGAGHGETRIFRTAYGEGTAYVPFLQEGRKLWLDLERETGVKLYSEIGRIIIGHDDDGSLDEEINGAKQYNLPYEVLTPNEAEKRFPQHIYESNNLIYVDPTAGYIKPELAIETAVAHAQDLGAKLYTNTKVTKIDPNDEGVKIYTEDQVFHVKKVIMSVGAWTSQLLPSLNFPIWVERQVLLWYKARNPELFHEDQFPIFSRNIEEHRLYGFPSLDENLVKVAFHHGGESVHPDTIDRSIQNNDTQLMSSYIKKYIPNLIPQSVKGKVCMYTNTEDNHFIIGPLASIPNVTMLGPMAGHGFKFATIMGKLAAEAATESSLTLPIDMFEPERFTNLTK